MFWTGRTVTVLVRSVYIGGRVLTLGDMARPRTFDEAAVVTAARHQFWSSGYADTGLRDLMAATGLAKASLYNAFGDKHALYLRAFQSYCTTTLDRVAAQLDGPDDEAAARLTRLIDEMAEDRGSQDTPPTACFLAKATTELAAHDPEVAAIAQRTYRRFEALLTGAVEAAQRAGALPLTEDARSVARHILVALRGVEALVSAGVDHTVVADAAAHLVKTVLHDRG